MVPADLEPDRAARAGQVLRVQRAGDCTDRGRRAVQERVQEGKGVGPEGLAHKGRVPPREVRGREAKEGVEDHSRGGERRAPVRAGEEAAVLAVLL
jgi:hypothetical protein